MKHCIVYTPAKEDIYGVQLEGFDAEGSEGLANFWNKALYGLGQMYREWNDLSTKFITDVDCVRKKAYYTVYLLKGNENFVFQIVYVDDVLLAGNYQATIVGGTQKVLEEDGNQNWESY